MAEKKQHTIISADTGAEVKPGAAPKPQTHTVKPAAEVGNAGGLRIGAVVLWALAILFEVLAVLVAFGKINLTFLPQMPLLIVYTVIGRTAKDVSSPSFWIAAVCNVAIMAAALLVSALLMRRRKKEGTDAV